MADETRTQVYGVRVEATDALKELAELNLRAAELREQQKALGPVTKENAQEYTRLGAEMKATRTQASQLERNIQNSIKVQNAAEASLEKLRAQLALDNAEYAKLGNTIEDQARKDVLGKQIAENVASLKMQEEALGDHRRSVGDYEKANRNLRGELREFTQQLQQMAAAGDTSSESYGRLRKQAEDLRTAIDNVNQEIRAGSSNTAQIDTLNQSAQGVVATFTLWKSASALLGKENSDLDKIVKQVVVAMAALNALTTISNTLYKTSNTYRAASNLLQKVGINQTAAEAKALAAKNAAMASGNVLTKTANTLTWLWNAALAANPVVVVALGVGALVGAIGLLTGAFKSSTTEANTHAEALKNIETINDRLDRKLQNIADRRFVEVERARIQGRREIQELRNNNSTKEQLAQAEYDAAKRVRDAEVAAARERVQEYEAARRQIERQIVLINQQIEAVDKNSTAHLRLVQALEATKLALNDNARAITETNAAITNTLLDQIDADQAYTKSTKDLAKERAKTALQAFETQSTLAQKQATDMLRIQNQFIRDDIRARQKYEQDLFAIQQNGERERLTARRKANTITQKEYEAQIKALDTANEVFQSDQLVSLNNHFTEVRKTLIRSLDATQEEQIAETIKNYHKAVKQLESIETPVRLTGMSDEDWDKVLKEYEEFQYNRTAIALRLEQERDKEIERIREASLAKRVAEIDKALNKEYEGDLAKYSDNERKKLDVQEAMLKKRIEAYKKAGKDTNEAEAQLRAIGLARIQLDLNKELIQADKNNRAKYEARKKALEAELLLIGDNRDRQLEIQVELREAWMDYFDDLISTIESYAQSVGDIFTGITDLINTNSDRQLQKVKAQYDQENLALARKYSLGLLTEAQYNEEQLKLDQQRERDEAKIERQRAIREREAKVFSVITDTAMGIVKAVAASPLTFGLPWSAFVGATGALNLATILAEPLPKAARGMYINGPSHAGGGVNLEAEGGEVIINKRSASMFLPLLSAINRMGGGVPFTTPFSDGGFAVRQAGGGVSDNADTVTQLENLFSQIKLVATIQDIREADEDYLDIESAGTF